MYSQIGREWRSLVKSSSSVYKQRAIAWRRGPTVVRLSRPTRLDRAKSLGYKAKQGIVVVRIKIVFYRRGRFVVPLEETDYEANGPSEPWITVRSASHKDSDTVIICGSDDLMCAEYGTISAALTLF